MDNFCNLYFRSVLSLVLISLITTNQSFADDIEHYIQSQKSNLSTPQFDYLDYSDINALLKRGNSMEKQLVLKYLITERYNAQKLELLVSYYIHIKRNDIANYWIKWAQENNVSIKPWQKLHIAIVSKDKRLIKNILETEYNNLDESMIKNALNSINEDISISLNRHKYLTPKISNHNSIIQNQRINTLGISNTNNTFFSFSTEKLGELSIHSSSVSGEIKTGGSAITIIARNNSLETKSSEFVPIEYIADEVDLSFMARKRFHRSAFSFGMGNNHRTTESITYTYLKYEYQHNNSINGTFSIDYNKISDITPELRALGYKNKASFDLFFKPKIDYSFYFSINSHKYKTRMNDNIGEGYGLNASISHILFNSQSYWDISFRSSLEDNKLVSSLPGYITTFYIKQAAEIIDEESKFIGLGTIYKYPFNINSRYKFNNISLNAYTGLTLPEESINYGMDIEYGYAFSRNNILGIKLNYSNIYNTIEDNGYTKIMLYYKFDI